jgi:hypothetical protein
MASISVIRITSLPGKNPATFNPHEDAKGRRGTIAPESVP